MKHLHTRLLFLTFLLCGSGLFSSVLADNTSTTARLRIQSACDDPLWIFHTVGSGGGSLNAPAKVKLATKNDHVDYDIPDKGLAGVRFWPGAECDTLGNNCKIGSSGGPNLTCPSEGCAPPVDSKFEGTFGCLSSVNKSDCQVNPSSPTGATLPRTDNWDTSMVDGFTLPYKVTVAGNCPGGPKNATIDCSDLKWSYCPKNETIGSSKVNLRLKYPGENKVVGCYSPCSKLTMNNWGNSPTSSPSSSAAEYYCCGGISASDCRSGVGATTEYVKNIHTYCPQTYAYAYDDGTGLFGCPASKSTTYTVTFYCPK
ncbi:thaumatin family protein [Marinicella sp. W31]|uniref:thaumatin family protein n=1 Tax=Marinicella sp. W31 TaxID=3023713 RepID=UPI003757A678